ncbi:fumarylacetoacetate hydrolase family protein [Amnibacterium kyonggiense]|uniref:2-keto-4-pentenoate hydratase/2-oxohepta-3-ene-1,7-dioic acid hydratase in catechol pathway n=1 Tax=Amnibacterium kyonggiense TaxID=595671 RepID=A0A4V3EAF1_9MICO|nr:fumarylacetoacetate hydrolase family protein [Amnibacterium kyonggiense]TDS76138.1 2-keto-4-pentenoate hydratase/2-oxohepta-3-ene-1,7-dioic acid hydratase in catechol pathway [Amnibacterium kyonggiense]
MKIARFTSGGSDPQFGIVDDEDLVVIAGDPMFQGFETTGERVPLAEAKLLAPVIPRSKIVGMGLNYPGIEAVLPPGSKTEPVIFLKPNTSVIGPNDVIQLPPVPGRIIHEGELAIVIGSVAKRVPAEDADQVIFGYTIANDVTALDRMIEDGQWARGKGYDTFCPIGPFIETEIDPRGVPIRTVVDGEERSSGHTRDLVLSIPEIVEMVSDVWTLLPGDVILTGSSNGDLEIRPGQRVEVEIGTIGRLVNTTRARA